MQYTAEQVAAAIAEPRVGDAWESSGIKLVIAETKDTSIWYRVPPVRGSFRMEREGEWPIFTSSATLVHRAGEGE